MTARVWGARLAAILWVSAAVADELPLEAYGKLPTISMMALSATGTRIAYRRTEDESDVIAVQDLRDGSFLASLDVSTTNPRGIQFIGDEYVILLASEPVRFFNLRRQHDIRGAYVFECARFVAATGATTLRSNTGRHSSYRRERTSRISHQPIMRRYSGVRYCCYTRRTMPSCRVSKAGEWSVR